MITAEQIAALADGGPYWWLRADGTVYATESQSPQDSSDNYLLRASEQWLAQWGGDWQPAADQINEALTRQEGS